jgi:hypothetical protein
MAKRKKSSKPEYSFSTIKLVGYRASIDASIGHEVRDPRHYYDDAKVYDFRSQVEMEGIFMYPEERIDEKIQMTVLSSDSDHHNFDLTLKDCHVRDDHGSPKYRKARGKEIPIYDIPKGIGYIEKQRGTRDWIGCAWVRHYTLTDMLTLLPDVRPLYITFHERRLDRTNWIVGLTLQTNNPEEE